MSEKWTPSISRKKWLKLRLLLGSDWAQPDKTGRWFIELIVYMESFSDEE